MSSHALAREVLTDTERFSAANALDAVEALPARVLRVLTRHRFRLPPTMANNDTPTHPRMRELFGEVFAPQRVSSLEQQVEEWTNQTVDDLRTSLDCDGVADLDALVSAEIPLRALVRLLELPAESTAVVKEFSRSALEMFWGRPDLDRQLELAEIIGPHHAELRHYVRQASGPVGSVRDEIGEDEATGAVFFLLVAGQETTAQFVTLLLHYLVEHPRALENGDGAAVVEEGLRLFPSIVSWRRRVRSDTTIGSEPVKAGESVLVWLAEAGRDAGVAECPREFVPHQRGSRRHLAFGAGKHRCLGSQLTRLEARIIVDRLREVIPTLRTVSAPRSDDNMSFRMPGPYMVRRVS